MKIAGILAQHGIGAAPARRERVRPDTAQKPSTAAAELERELREGIVPHGWSERVWCSGCGLVWLWPACAPRVIACPWCWRRRAGSEIPRPRVACETCAHFRCDAVNADSGAGTCAVVAPASQRGRLLWPGVQRSCAEFQPVHTSAGVIHE